jgi:hypothetical protein
MQKDLETEKWFHAVFSGAALIAMKKAEGLGLVD